MIRPEIPEPFALLNYKNALFVVDTQEEAINAVKNAAKEITGFDHEISLKKSFIGNKQYFNMSHDPKGYDLLFRNRISLRPVNGNQILSIQLRDGQEPIEYTMELTSKIYRQLYKQLTYSIDE